MGIVLDRDTWGKVRSEPDYKQISLQTNGGLV